MLKIGSVIVSTSKQDFDIQEFVDNAEFRSERAIENIVNTRLCITIAQVIE